MVRRGRALEGKMSNKNQRPQPCICHRLLQLEATRYSTRGGLEMYLDLGGCRWISCRCGFGNLVQWAPPRKSNKCLGQEAMSKGPLSTGCTPLLYLLPCPWWPETPAVGKRQASITIRLYLLNNHT